MSGIVEYREDVPLRSTNSKNFRVFYIFTCRGIYPGECLSGLGLIYTIFLTISIIITAILFMQISYGAYQIEPHGNVVSDAYDCSSIGTYIIKKGGNAVDGGIASTICLAIVNQHITGLAAGGIAMVYSHRLRNLPEIIDFGASVKLDNFELPRLIIGLANLHRKFGKIEWKMLFIPTINLARNGFVVSKMFATSVELSKTYHLFGKLKPGQLLKQAKLANTLEVIANLTSIQLDNFLVINNEPIYSKAINITFFDHNIYLPSLKSKNEIILSNILNNLEHDNFNTHDITKSDYVYHVAEVIKNNYFKLNASARLYENTASTVVTTDHEELYFVIITGLNGILGSQQMAPLGFILDNQPTEPNEESISETQSLPIIITDKNFICGRRALFGSGDVSLATQILINLFIGNQSLINTIEAPRFRILNDNEIGIEETHEPSFTEKILNNFHDIGKLISLAEPYDGINIIQIFGDNPELYADSRSGGAPSQF